MNKTAIKPQPNDGRRLVRATLSGGAIDGMVCILPPGSESIQVDGEWWSLDLDAERKNGPVFEDVVFAYDGGDVEVAGIELLQGEVARLTVETQELVWQLEAGAEIPAAIEQAKGIESGFLALAKSLYEGTGIQPEDKSHD
jgi:hypothetical protein